MQHASKNRNMFMINSAWIYSVYNTIKLKIQLCVLMQVETSKRDERYTSTPTALT